MGKVKNTKTELKAQRDSLKRYRRYLPTLQLKKQQLQMEIRQVDQRVAEKKAEEGPRAARWPAGSSCIPIRWTISPG